MGCPGDPASRCRHRPRGRSGSAALAPGAARGCSGLAAGDAGASPRRPDADGRSGREDPSPVGQRAPGRDHRAPPPWRPSGEGRGKVHMQSPRSRGPRRIADRFSRGCHDRLRSRFRLSAISGPRRAGPRWAGARRHADPRRSRRAVRHPDRGAGRRGDERRRRSRRRLLPGHLRRHQRLDRHRAAPGRGWRRQRRWWRWQRRRWRQKSRCHA